MKYQSAILASGGMDSFLLWSLSPKREESINVFVNVGQKYFYKEWNALVHLSDTLGQAFKIKMASGPNLKPYELPSGIIPNRNASLILAAAQFSTTIELGVLAHEINSDKSSEFMRAMEWVLDISNRGQYWNDNISSKYSIKLPLVHLTKSEAVARYLALGEDPSILLSTVSCYSDLRGHCGACPSCFKRWVALVNNNLPSDAFTRPPLRWAKEQGILSKCQDGSYAPQRAQEILSAVVRTQS